MRVPLIAGNWKMNTTVAEAVKLVNEMKPELELIAGVEKLVCPPFISLYPVQTIIQGSTIKLGAQNVYFESKGAFTGEVSAPMLAGLCEYVIIGHSERRQYFHENGEIVSKKIKAALKSQIRPILCVGEKLNEYEAGQTREVVRRQLDTSLAGIMDISAIAIAYEPVWAIGTGKAATGHQANETIALIRNSISKKYGPTTGLNTRILYGGSVNAANIEEFVGQPEIDGALVGGASLKAAEFIGIVAKTAHARKQIS